MTRAALRSGATSNSSCNMHVYLLHAGAPTICPDRVLRGIPSRRASFKVLVIDRSLSLIDTEELKILIASGRN